MSLSSNVVTTGKWVKIGTLLLKSGIIQPEAFTQAMERSKQGDALVGSVLVRMGWVKHEELGAALYLQTLLAEGVLYPDLAVKAMKLVHEQGSTAQGALHALGWRAAVQSQVDDIEYLLTEPGFVSRQLYYSIVSKSKSAFSLVLRGTLRCNQFNEVLKAVSMVRGNVCSLEQATDALKAYRSNGVPLEETLRRSFGLSVHKISMRLGELLIQSCILSEAEVLVAVEKSLRTRSRLGDCLMNSNALPVGALDICLEIQSLAASGILDPQLATKMAKRCIDLKQSVADYLTTTRVLNEPIERAVVMIGLLKQAQLISDDDIRQAHAMTSKYCLGPTAALAVTHRIDRHTYQALWYFDSLIQKEELRPDQAVVALMWCQRTGGDAEEAVLNISGKFRQLKVIESEKEQEKEQVSNLKQLQDESKALFDLLHRQKSVNHRAFFAIGVVLAMTALVTTGILLPESALVCGGLAVFLCLAAYFACLAQTRNLQARSDDEERKLAASIAVRRAARKSSIAQRSIAS